MGCLRSLSVPPSVRKIDLRKIPQINFSHLLDKISDGRYHISMILSECRRHVAAALRSARQERSARRQDGYDVAAEAPSAETESADSKVTSLSR